MIKSNVVKNLVKYENKILKSVPKMTLQTAEKILVDSNELVPIDSGALRDSGGVYQDPKTGEASVYYTADYALIVHENLEAVHPIGEAKFLEKALYANKDEFLKNIKEAVKV